MTDSLLEKSDYAYHRYLTAYGRVRIKGAENSKLRKRSERPPKKGKKT